MPDTDLGSRGGDPAPATVPTDDQSYCDVGEHQYCSGYTEDGFDPETCFCQCHIPPDLEF